MPGGAILHTDPPPLRVVPETCNRRGVGWQRGHCEPTPRTIRTIVGVAGRRMIMTAAWSVLLDQAKRAEATLRRTLEMQRKTLEPDHPQLARTLSDLG